MDLRSELTPPKHDESLVDRLVQLVERLDSDAALSGDRDDELAEFNQFAGTTLDVEAFQGIYRMEEAEEFVRRALILRDVPKVPDLTREEMIEIVSRIIQGEDQDFYLYLFIKNCKHPGESGLIFGQHLIPELPHDREATAEEIADCAMNWEPRTVAMEVVERLGGESVGYLIYTLEAPQTPQTQVVTPLDVVYETGTVLAVALKGVELEDGSIVETTYELGAMSCGKILGVTDQPVGNRIE